jgi:hypothetical protein
MLTHHYVSTLIMFCTMFVLVYVDDIIVANSVMKFTNCLVKKLNQEFALKDLSDVHNFLGIEVNRMRGGLPMTQERYTKDILHHVNMDTCRFIFCREFQFLHIPTIPHWDRVKTILRYVNMA